MIRNITTIVIKRFFDITVASALLIVLWIPVSLIMLMVRVSSRGPVLYWSNRLGKNNVIFKMPKFRTMRVDAPDVATHLLRNPPKYLTPFGRFLRRFSLDELPQLWSVLKGDMSFVGPRPALYNQADLIELRTRKGIHKLIPGITGWAQVNGRDNLTIFQKVKYDEYYKKHRSCMFDLKIICLTLVKVLRSEGVHH
jgi:O-antigen biosynthesis protein WbqP